MKIIAYIFFTIIIAIYSTVLSGWAIAKLWAWFIVTTFGLPHLTIPAAIGLAIMVEYFQPTPEPKEQEYRKTLLNTAFMGMFKPFVCVLVGLIVKHWL